MTLCCRSDQPVMDVPMVTTMTTSLEKSVRKVQPQLMKIVRMSDPSGEGEPVQVSGQGLPEERR